MRIKYLILLLVISVTTFSQTLTSRREIREVELSNTGYELGFQHGKLLKNEIGEIVGKMKKNTTDILKKDADLILKDFFSYANFTNDIKKYIPDLYEEVRGIAEGSEQAFNDIMVLNLLDELWVYIDNVNNHHCSSLGVPSIKGSPSYIAQNMDLETYLEGHQVLIRLSKTTTRPEQLILTYPGCIALNGMNEKGVGVCVNTLMQLNASSKGLPVAFMIRHVIGLTEKKALLNFIQTTPHASGQNYIIGIRGEVYDFEASANRVVRFDPKNTNGTVYHTNHPIVNNDVKAWFKKEKSENANTHIRLASVQKRVSESIIDDTLIKETLSSKDDIANPVCRSVDSGRGIFTFSSVIMMLTDTPYLQVTAGSPDQSDYKRIDFTGK